MSAASQCSDYIPGDADGGYVGTYTITTAAAAVATNYAIAALATNTFPCRAIARVDQSPPVPKLASVGTGATTVSVGVPLSKIQWLGAAGTPGGFTVAQATGGGANDADGALFSATGANATTYTFALYA
jgi:hypothetical protein